MTWRALRIVSPSVNENRHDPLRRDSVHRTKVLSGATCASPVTVVVVV
jgi:hypothetical protein